MKVLKTPWLQHNRPPLRLEGCSQPRTQSRPRSRMLPFQELHRGPVQKASTPDTLPQRASLVETHRTSLRPPGIGAPLDQRRRPSVEAPANPRRSHLAESSEAPANPQRSHLVESVEAPANPQRSHLVESVEAPANPQSSHRAESIEAPANPRRSHLAESMIGAPVHLPRPGAGSIGAPISLPRQMESPRLPQPGTTAAPHTYPRTRRLRESHGATLHPLLRLPPLRRLRKRRIRRYPSTHQTFLFT